LISALTDAGFRTQVALAERIAELEGLDAAPKDIVNRVFRELPVEFTTLERVARALDVEAYTLYRTTTDAARQDFQESTGPQQKLPKLNLALALAVALAVLFAVVWNGPWFENESLPFAETGSDSGSSAAGTVLDLGATTLVVMTLHGDEYGLFSDALREALGGHFSVASQTASAITGKLDPQAVADRLRTEVVIDGEVVTVGRLTAVRIYLLARGVRQQIWAESWPTVAIPDHYSTIVNHVSLATRQAVGTPIPGGALSHFPVTSVQDDYLEGELHMDRPSNELNLKRAQSRFEAALRQDANYARAHAGLCETLLEEHWMSDEERALKDAAGACGQALQLRPDDPVIAAAHAHFLRRTGRNDAAIALYEKTAARHPKDSTVLLGLANSRLDAYRQSGDRQVLVSAKEAARAAASIDPSVWKPLFALATMEWFDGNLNAAISVSEEALKRDENEKILGNLGSFYICAGKFDSARDLYLRAKMVNPQSYIGDEFLGQAFYFLGAFQESAEYRQRAVNSIATGSPEIHEMWGNLGDSYRQTGQKDEAVNAYNRAAEIAERDYLRGTAPAADRAARAYYYTALNHLNPGSVPDEVMSAISDEVDEIARVLESATANRRMAQIYVLREEIDKAYSALQHATATCPGYGVLPDFAGLQMASETIGDIHRFRRENK